MSLRRDPYAMTNRHVATIVTTPVPRCLPLLPREWGPLAEPTGSLEKEFEVRLRGLESVGG